MTDVGFSPTDTYLVSNTILATNLKYNVDDTQDPLLKHMQCIIRDADVSHLASKHFEHLSECLRKEISSVFKKDVSESSWQQGNLEFFIKHSWLSTSAKTLWEELKRFNYEQILKKIELSS
ncbi:hypothetical protein GEMRC1_006397 [Eukaryota sp. GEM-RC1]